MTIDPHKYVTFKRTDLERILQEDRPHLYTADAELDDAVVIRLGDVFAAPALHDYANTITTVLSLHTAGTITLKPGDVEHLEDLADYFADRGDAAEKAARHIPD